VNLVGEWRERYIAEVKLCEPHLLFLALFVGGCWASADVPPIDSAKFDWVAEAPKSQQAAIDGLASLDRRYFDGAWDRLTEFGFVEETRLTVRDGAGDVTGQTSLTERTNRSGGQSAKEVLTSDSTGVFEYSFWSRFSDSDASEDAVDWATLVLPGDLLFLKPQGPSFFRYRTLADTTIGNAGVQVVETAARPESKRQGIQWARLYLQGDYLVGVEVLLVQRSLLYNEVSRFRLMLTLVDGREWLPHSVHVASTVGLPFARSRTYELTKQFSEFAY